MVEGWIREQIMKGGQRVPGSVVTGKKPGRETSTESSGLFFFQQTAAFSPFIPLLLWLFISAEPCPSAARGHRLGAPEHRQVTNPNGSWWLAVMLDKPKHWVDFHNSWQRDQIPDYSFPETCYFQPTQQCLCHTHKRLGEQSRKPVNGHLKGLPIFPLGRGDLGDAGLLFLFAAGQSLSHRGETWRRLILHFSHSSRFTYPNVHLYHKTDS